MELKDMYDLKINSLCSQLTTSFGIVDDNFDCVRDKLKKVNKRCSRNAIGVLFLGGIMVYTACKLADKIDDLDTKIKALNDEFDANLCEYVTLLNKDAENEAFDDDVK